MDPHLQSKLEVLDAYIDSRVSGALEPQVFLWSEDEFAGPYRKGILLHLKKRCAQNPGVQYQLTPDGFVLTGPAPRD